MEYLASNVLMLLMKRNIVKPRPQQQDLIQEYLHDLLFRDALMDGLLVLLMTDQ